MKHLERERESKESLSRKKEHLNWNDQLISGSYCKKTDENKEKG